MISRDDYARSSRTAPNPRPHFASHFELDHINPHVTKPVWMVHNHPSGDPTPSEADLTMTKEIQKGCRYLGLTLHDHIIVGAGTELSLRALGKL